MNYMECLESRLEIHKLFKRDDTHIVVVYKYKQISLYNTLSCKRIASYHTELLNTKTTAVAFDAHCNNLAIANGNVIYLFHLNTQEIIQTIPTFDEEVMQLHFLENSPYIVAGTRNGRVVLYTKEGKAALGRICSFPLVEKKELLHAKNYVSVLTSYKNYLACSGYGGDIIIIKPNSLTHKHIIHNSLIQTTAIKFLNHHTLLYGNAKGELYHYDIYTQTKKMISTPFVGIDFIEIVGDGAYAIVGTRNAHTLMLFDINKKSIVKHHYISCETYIQNIMLFGTKLFIQLAKHTLLVYELDNTEKLQDYVTANKLALAYALVDENPLLRHTKAYEMLEEKYTQLYQHAVDELIHANKKGLKKLLSIFETSQQYKEELVSLQKAFENYPKLKMLYREKKYAIALSLIDKYPQLSHTPEAKKLEQRFKEDFAFAQKQILLAKLEIAQEVLGNYLIVPSKKEICSLLLRNNKAFITFLQALHNKEYKTVFELSQKYEVFTTISSFLELQKEIDEQLQSLYRDIESMRVDVIKKKIQKLQHIPTIAPQIKTVFQTLIALEKLMKNYEKKNDVACYEALDTTPLLSNTQLSILLEKHWSKIIHQCEHYALKGDIKGVKETLKELIHIKTRTESIGNLLRLSFQTKIKQLLAKRLLYKAELLIYSYIDIFGLDTQLQHIITQYEKLSSKNLAITMGEVFHISRESWRHSSIMNS